MLLNNSKTIRYLFYLAQLNFLINHVFVLNNRYILLKIAEENEKRMLEVTKLSAND